MTDTTVNDRQKWDKNIPSALSNPVVITLKPETTIFINVKDPGQRLPNEFNGSDVPYPSIGRKFADNYARIVRQSRWCGGG